MPYAKYLIPDRATVGKATYNLRNLVKNIRDQDIPEPHKQILIDRIQDFESYLKNSIIEYHDDGTIMGVPTHGPAYG